ALAAPRHAGPQAPLTAPTRACRAGSNSRSDYCGPQGRTGRGSPQPVGPEVRMSVVGHSLPTGSRPERAGPAQTSPVPPGRAPGHDARRTHMAAPVADRSKALEAALSQIDRQFGKGSIMRLGDDSRPKVEVIPTGSVDRKSVVEGESVRSTRTRSKKIDGKP